MFIKRVEILQGKNFTVSLYNVLIQPIIDALTDDAAQFLGATKLVYFSQVASFLFYL